MNTSFDEEIALEQRLRAHYRTEYADTPDGSALWQRVAGRLGLIDAPEGHALETATGHDADGELRVNGRAVHLPVPTPPAVRPRRDGRLMRRLRAGMAVAAAGLLVAMSIAIFHFAAPRHGTGGVTLPQAVSGGGETIPHGALISDLQMLSPTEGWAVGSANDQQTALVLHFAGGQWRVVASFANARLEHLSMVSATEGWAVGPVATMKGDQHGHRSFLVRYSGGKWVRVPAPIDDASAIHMFSAESGYLVGGGTVTDPSGATTPPDVLAIYDHGHWRTSTLPTFLFPVALTLPTEGWSADDHQFWHLHDGAWTPTGNTFPSGWGPWIDMVSMTTGWAAGYAVTGVVTTKGPTIPGHPYLLVYSSITGEGWVQVPLPAGIPANSELRFVHMQSAESGWAWGFTNSDVPPLLLRYDAFGWSRVPLPGNVDLTAISSVSPDEAWAAGQIGAEDSVLLHYLAGKWTVYHL